jgi:hypothetical protein
MVCVYTLQIPVPKKRSLPKAKFPKGRPQFPQGAFGSLDPYHPPPPTLPLLSSSSNFISHPMARYYCFSHKHVKLQYECLCFHRAHSLDNFCQIPRDIFSLYSRKNPRLPRYFTFVISKQIFQHCWVFPLGRSWKN